MFLAHWMTGLPDNCSCDFVFLSKQLDAPSKGMLLVIILLQMQSVLYWIRTSVHNFYLCFDFESHIGHQNMLHSVCYCLCATGCRVNSKQRQRQNTAEFRCKLHLLTLELINILYHMAVKNWNQH